MKVDINGKKNEAIEKWKKKCVVLLNQLQIDKQQVEK